MALIRFSWCHTSNKEVNTGEVYEFIETMRFPSKTNRYKGKVTRLSTTGQDIELDIEVVKPDTNKRYSVGELIKRMWHKEDANSGTTLIYNTHETGINHYPDTTVQFIDSSDV